MKNNTYVTIQSWMRTELDLSGNELMVYAIIYGFSQDGVSKFTGSRQYLADWCGCTVRSIQTVLNNLVDRGLIKKTENIVNNLKQCEYVVNFTGEKISPPSEKISLNNIDNTKIDNISKDILSEDDEVQSKMYSADDFLGSRKRSKTADNKKKGKDLYSKCIAEIDQFTVSLKLRTILITYLNYRLNIKDKPLYVNQWKGLLNKLSEMSSDENTLADIVQQSIDKGWLSFYPLKQFSKHDVFSEYGEVDCSKKEEVYVDRDF
jgi:hypothetical protein